MYLPLIVLFFKLSEADLLTIGRFAESGSVKLDRSLLTALVDRWRPETNTFHLPCGWKVFLFVSISKTTSNGPLLQICREGEPAAPLPDGRPPAAQWSGGRGPAARQVGGRDLYVNKKKFAQRSLEGACRPPAGRQAPYRPTSWRQGGGRLPPQI